MRRPRLSAHARIPTVLTRSAIPIAPQSRSSSPSISVRKYDARNAEEVRVKKGTNLPPLAPNRRSALLEAGLIDEVLFPITLGKIVSNLLSMPLVCRIDGDQVIRAPFNQCAQRVQALSQLRPGII
jgi:hypothetical protein